MSLRALLVAVITVATIAFVAGVSIERSSDDSHSDQGTAAEAGESAEQRAAENETGAGSHDESTEELKPLGVDLEATPFVALAVLASLALALAAWRRPRSPALLLAVAGVMLAFAVLDVREVFHQDDEGRTGLAILAGAVAPLHLTAAGIAGFMARGRRLPA